MSSTLFGSNLVDGSINDERIHDIIWETSGSAYSLDPHVNYESYGQWITYNIYETLFTDLWHTSDATPYVPLLAESVSVPVDGVTYTFTLRQGITFHDGTAFNATAVQMNFWRMLGRGWDDGWGPVWMIAEPILGGQAVEDAVYTYGDGSPEHIAAWANWQENVPAVVVNSEFEVEVHLAYPYTPFIAVLSSEVGAMISPSFFMAHGGMSPVSPDTTLDHEACGTGPYELVEWIPDETVELILNEDYWRASASEGAGSIHSVIIKSNFDTNSRKLNLEAGTSDGCYWPKSDATEIFGTTNPDIFVSTGSYSLELLFAGFNMKEVQIGDIYYTSPFSNIHFRKAISLAFPYEELIDTEMNGFGVPARGPIPMGMFGHNGTTFDLTTDIDAAVVEWNLAMSSPEFVDSLNQLNNTVTLFYVANSEQADIFYSIMYYTLDELWSHPNATRDGLNSSMVCVLEGLEWSMWLDATREHRMFICLSGWTPDFTDPDGYLYSLVYHRGIFPQRIGYNNTLVNSLYNEQKGAWSPEDRLVLLSLIQETVGQDVPYLWLAQETEFRVWRSWLQGDGLIYNPMHDIYFYHVYKTGDQVTPVGDPVFTGLLIIGIVAEIVIIGTLIVYRVRRRD